MSMYIFVHAHICTVHSLVCSLILWLFLAPLPPQHFFSFLFFIWYLFFFARGGQRWARTCSECERVGLSVCRWLNAYVYMRACPCMHSALVCSLILWLFLAPLPPQYFFFHCCFHMIFIFFCAGEQRWARTCSECERVGLSVCRWLYTYVYMRVCMYVQSTPMRVCPCVCSPPVSPRPSTPTTTTTTLGFLATFSDEQRRRLQVNRYCKWNPEVYLF